MGEVGRVEEREREKSRVVLTDRSKVDNLQAKKAETKQY
jgi:hypothetical protein